MFVAFAPNGEYLGWTTDASLTAKRYPQSRLIRYYPLGSKPWLNRYNQQLERKSNVRYL